MHFFFPMPATCLTLYTPTYLLTYLLTPWCRVLLEKLTGLQLVQRFPAFHGTRRFFTALTSVRHLSLSWASPIQSIYPYPTSWRSILILSTHLRLGLPIGLFPSGLPSNTLYTPSPHPYAPHAQPISLTDKLQMTILSIRFASWVTKATKTHSEYVILIVFPLQKMVKRTRLNIVLYLRCMSGRYCNNIIYADM